VTVGGGIGVGDANTGACASTASRANATLRLADKLQARLLLLLLL
jgi:hypothetical protein